MTAKKKDPEGPEMEYGAARRELEEILRSLEEGEVEVDGLAGKVERAAELIRICREKLHAQEVKIRKVAAELEKEAAAEGEDAGEEVENEEEEEEEEE